MDKLISLRAERHRRKARREKLNCETCTLPTIQLGPAGRSVLTCSSSLFLMTVKVVKLVLSSSITALELKPPHANV